MPSSSPDQRVRGCLFRPPLSYRLAAEASDQIAAIAPVAGAMASNDLVPDRPVPVMHIHSVDDPRALYAGGLGPPFPGTRHRVEHQAVEEIVALWTRFNGCPQQPVVGATLSDGDQGHTATRYTYGPCTGETEVVLWKLAGAGHVWPGGQAGFLEQILGPSTQVIDANEKMWQFFSRYATEAAYDISS